MTIDRLFDSYVKPNNVIVTATPIFKTKFVIIVTCYYKTKN